MSTSSWLRAGAAASALALPAALLATAAPAAAQAQLPEECAESGGQVVCTFDEPGEYDWTVPAGTTEATFDVYGAQGGNTDYGSGGLGGFATAAIPVGSYDTLLVRVGGRGGNGAPQQPGDGGFNGGGAGGGFSGGGGGGASDVRTPPGDLDDRIIVAGGGGGASANTDGGDGGGQAGAEGEPLDAYGGGGGTQTAGGAGGRSGLPGAAEDGVLGHGGAGTDLSGGGGGGYYGGGGGHATSGGGGGSGYLDPDATTDGRFGPATEIGDGRVIITYTPPVDETDLAITKQCAPGTVAPGDTVSCTLTVTNHGEADATGITITDRPGDGLTLTGAPTGGGFSCDTSISCTRDELAAGQHATIGYTATTAADLGPEVTIRNTATASAESPEDPDTTNNTISAEVSTSACTVDARGASWGQAIVGTPGDDVICGSRFADAIRGGDGDDVIFGLGGSDGITGGPGNDHLYGGSGHDGIDGGAGDDTLYGAPGYDGLTGRAGADALDGGPQYDGCNPGPGDNPTPVNCP